MCSKKVEYCGEDVTFCGRGLTWINMSKILLFLAFYKQNIRAHLKILTDFLHHFQFGLIRWCLNERETKQ